MTLSSLQPLFLSETGVRFSGTVILKREKINLVRKGGADEGASLTPTEQKIKDLHRKALEYSFQHFADEERYYDAFVCENDAQSEELFRLAQKVRVEAFHIPHPKASFESTERAPARLRHILRLLGHAEEVFSYSERKPGAKKAGEAMAVIKANIIKQCGWENR